MVLALQIAGYTPIVLDNLSTGHRDAVLNAELIIGDMQDTALLKSLFQRHHFLAVMHFGSFIQIEESVREPLRYYQNNLAHTLTLLNTMLEHQVKYFIFSSSAAVYGEPRYTPLDEKHPLQPINPYGRSKYMLERVLEDCAHAHDFHYAALRYFNAAGADPQGRLHERHHPESHLIPLVLAAAAKQRTLTLYGHDYPTPDGTCVRDFIHVNDLCNAHLLALQFLLDSKAKQRIYNLGTGTGYSVKQVIDCAAHVTNTKIPYIVGPRRAGDAAILVADPRLAQKELGWQPVYSDLETIIRHANTSESVHEIQAICK